MAERPQNGVEHDCQLLSGVFGKEAQDEITVLLKQLVFTPVAAVRDWIREMLGAVQLYSHPSIATQQIDFEGSHAVKGDRQRDVHVELAPGLG